MIGDQRDRWGANQHIGDRKRGDQSHGFGIVHIDLMFRFNEDQQIIDRRVSEKILSVMTRNIGNVRWNLNCSIFAKGQQWLKLEISLNIICLRHTHSSLTFAHIWRWGDRTTGLAQPEKWWPSNQALNVSSEFELLPTMRIIRATRMMEYQRVQECHWNQTRTVSCISLSVHARSTEAKKKNCWWSHSEYRGVFAHQ